MAAELVGGAFLSASLQVLFDAMSSRDVMHFIRGKKLNEGLLNKLKIMLLSVTAVLNDAEEKQITNPVVKQWLDDLEEAIYDADDFMDQINTEALKCNIVEDEEYDDESNKTGKKLKFIMALPTLFSNSFDKAIEPKIIDILDRMEFIMKQMEVLALREGVQTRPLRRSSIVTALVDESSVFGRDADKEAVINLLLTDNVSNNNKVSVIPIVGMGGIGKTTLAQLVYDDHRTKNYDLRAWVTISDEFDVLTLTKIFFETITCQTCYVNDPYQLQVKLKGALGGKKFFLVLDDVWIENYDHWDALKSPFQFGAHGSKIIVTTRSERVASMMGSVPMYHLQTISDEDCWLLFTKHVEIHNINTAGSHQNMEVFGRKIVKKCKGLPLAVKSLGGLLRREQNVEEWERILNNEIWNQFDKQTNILPALWLSYHYLAPHLKRCFAYSSVFPKDYEFSKENLILLWMAEGLLQPQKNMTMEEFGDKCFNDLLSRSLFQQSSNSKSTFIMHDLMNDLATFVSGEFVLRLNGSSSQSLESKARHLSYMKFKKFEASLLKAKSLRTFIAIFPRMMPHIKLKWNDVILEELLPTLPCLRVLSLFQCRIKQLPDSIGNLKHLRYLDFSRSRLRKIPDTVCSLYNLQTLLLSCCGKLTMLPKDMGRLINLRHLDITRTPLKQMPLQMCNLIHLQTLTDFVLAKDSPGQSSIKELGGLGYLRGRLCISGLENVVDVADVLMVNMKEKKYLDELILKWHCTRHDTDDSQKERVVLDNLKPHTNLKKLNIEFYTGTRFPDWVADHSYSNLVHIHLKGCQNCYFLPPLGQLPSLQRLHIEDFDELVTIGGEFYSNDSTMSTKTAFRSLEDLHFENMPQWQEWSLGGGDQEDRVVHFPHLRRLSLKSCPKLTGALPETMETVQITRCESLEFPGNKFCASLKMLEINQSCDNVKSIPLECFPKLNQLKLMKCLNLESLSLSVEPAKPTVVQFLRSFHLNTCPKFVSFPEGGLSAPNMEFFSIINCENLKSLPAQMHVLLPSLLSIRIRDCSELNSFIGGDEKYCGFLLLKELYCYDCPKLNVCLPNYLPSLTRLEVWGCNQLVGLRQNADQQVNIIAAIPSLRTMRVENFSEESTTFPGLPDSIETIEIKGCKRLLFPWNQCYASLKKLEIEHSCDTMKSMPLDYFPKLTNLSLRNCLNLESFTIFSKKSIHSLIYFELRDCPKFVSFPRGGLPANKMTAFTIIGCKNLRSLPEQMHTLLPSLENFWVEHCPKLDSFPEGGLPSNLNALHILNCKELFANRRHWNIQTLTCLKVLRISGCEDVFGPFPERGLLLPTTLTHLYISNFTNLQVIDGRGLRHLALLRHLRLEKCNALQFLPIEGLPTSLSTLKIKECGVLKQRCQRDKGLDWHKISHIHSVEIDGIDVALENIMSRLENLQK